MTHTFRSITIIALASIAIAGCTSQNSLAKVKKLNTTASATVSLCKLAKSPNLFYNKEVTLKTTLGTTLRSGYFFYDASCPNSHVGVRFTDYFKKHGYEKFFKTVLQNSRHHKGNHYHVVVSGTLHIGKSMFSKRKINVFYISNIKSSTIIKFTND